MGLSSFVIMACGETQGYEYQHHISIWRINYIYSAFVKITLFYLLYNINSSNCLEMYFSKGGSIVSQCMHVAGQTFNLISHLSVYTQCVYTTRRVNCHKFTYVHFPQISKTLLTFVCIYTWNNIHTQMHTMTTTKQK